MLRLVYADFLTRRRRTFVFIFGTKILTRSRGRIMNRLSKDMSSIDTEAAESAHRSTPSHIVHQTLMSPSPQLLHQLCSFGPSGIAGSVRFNALYVRTCVCAQSLTSISGFLTVLLMIGILYWFVGSIYVTTSREVKRFDVSTPPSDSACPQELTSLERNKIAHLHQLFRSPCGHVHNKVVR